MTGTYCLLKSTLKGEIEWSFNLPDSYKVNEGSTCILSNGDWIIPTIKPILPTESSYGVIEVKDSSNQLTKYALGTSLFVASACYQQTYIVSSLSAFTVAPQTNRFIVAMKN